MKFWLLDDLPKNQLRIGQILATPGALAALRESNASLHGLLVRHMQGDWGDVGPEDWTANDQALIRSERILSAYSIENNQTLWIITEWDRSMTTVLLPEEY